MTKEKIPKDKIIDSEDKASDVIKKGKIRGDPLVILD